MVECDIDLIKDLSEDSAVFIDLTRILGFNALEDLLDRIEDDGRLVGVDYWSL